MKSSSGIVSRKNMAGLLTVQSASVKFEVKNSQSEGLFVDHPPSQAMCRGMNRVSFRLEGSLQCRENGAGKMGSIHIHQASEYLCFMDEEAEVVKVNVIPTWLWSQTN